MIHDHGLNCRYLGALARKAREMGATEEVKGNSKIEDIGADYPEVSVKLSGAWLDLLEVEIAARAAKKVLNRHLREEGTNKAVVLGSFLSALVCIGQETVGETDTREEEEGTTNEGVSSKGSLQWGDVWDDIRKEVGRRFRYELRMFPGQRLCVPLLRRVLIRSGITLLAREYGFEGKAMKHGTFHPIRPNDVLSLTPMVKDSQEGGPMRRYKPGAGGGMVWKDGEDALRVAAANLQIAAQSQANVNNAIGAAYQTLQGALSGYIELAGINSRWVLKPLGQLSRCLHLAGEGPTAVHHMAKYLSVATECLGRDHYKVRMAHASVAQMLGELGFNDVAAAHMGTAIAIANFAAGGRHEDTARSMVKVGGLEQGMGGEGADIIEMAVGREWGAMFEKLEAARLAGRMRGEKGEFEAAMKIEVLVGMSMKRFLGEGHEEVKKSKEIERGYGRKIVEGNLRKARGEEEGEGKKKKKKKMKKKNKKNGKVEGEGDKEKVEIQ